MGSADNKSGYVLAMTLNFDGNVNAGDTEQELQALGLEQHPAAFRSHARLWLPCEYESIVSGSTASSQGRAPKATPAAHRLNGV